MTEGRKRLIASLLTVWVAATCLVVVISADEAGHQVGLVGLTRYLRALQDPVTTTTTTTPSKSNQDQHPASQDRSPDTRPNEIDTTDEEQRIVDLKEPYKSMLQTTARFALAQTKLPNHISIDSAMSLLNDALYMLAKPSVLLKVIKLAMTSAVTLVGVSIVFPPANHWMYSLVHDPSVSLNLDRYLSNGQPERSVLEVVSARTDEALNRVGLQASQCRERSLCHLGEILNCFLPITSEVVIRFVKTHFPDSSPREHSTMMRAFLQGFVDKNCTKLAGSADASAAGARSEPAGGCLGNFLTTILGASQTGSANKPSS